MECCLYGFVPINWQRLKYAVTIFSALNSCAKKEIDEQTNEHTNLQKYMHITHVGKKFKLLYRKNVNLHNFTNHVITFCLTEPIAYAILTDKKKLTPFLYKRK